MSENVCRYLMPARIIMPLVGNGNILKSEGAHDDLRRELLAFFGGVTVSQGHGYYWDKHAGRTLTEDVVIYDVAVTAFSNSVRRELRDIAVSAAAALRQDSVMYSVGTEVVIEELASSKVPDPDGVHTYPPDMVAT